MRKAKRYGTTLWMLAVVWTALNPSVAAGGRWSSFMFQTENDLYAISDKSDKYYTNGIRFNGLRDPEFNSDWVERFGARWCERFCGDESAVITSGFAFGQNFYTPEDITIAALIPDDRPYAAWLYGAYLVQITNERRSWQHAFELQVGVVGPEAGGEWSQKSVHELTDSTMPEGWDNQIEFEPGLSLIYLWRKRYGGSTFDFVPHLGGSVGNIMLMADGGFTVRLGKNISGFPHLLIPTTALAPDARPKFEVFVFAGVDGRAVARNIFLDGNTFKDSHSVDKKYFVYDLKGGLSIRLHSWRFDYSLVRRSKEFDQGKDQTYGSISFSFERGF